MSWQRSQTPAMFALCLSECGREEWEWKGSGGILFHFPGYVPQTVGMFLQKYPAHASPLSLSTPVSMCHQKMQCLESVTSAWDRRSAGEVKGMGGSGSVKVCNLISSSGEDC